MRWQQRPGVLRLVASAASLRKGGAVFSCYYYCCCLLVKDEIDALDKAKAVLNGAIMQEILGEIHIPPLSQAIQQTKWADMLILPRLPRGVGFGYLGVQYECLNCGSGHGFRNLHRLQKSLQVSMLNRSLLRKVLQLRGKDSPVLMKYISLCY